MGNDFFFDPTLTENVKVAPPGTDYVSNAQTMVSLEHHEIHAEDHYYMSGNATLEITAHKIFSLLTPNTEKKTHLTFNVIGSDKTALVIYEGGSADTASAGTAASVFNSYRDSSNVTGNVVKEDPSIVDTGDIIFDFSAGANNQAGFVSRGNEIVLKKNTFYILDMISGNNNNLVNWLPEWYEHTDVRSA